MLAEPTRSISDMFVSLSIVTKFVSGFVALGFSFSCTRCSRRGDGKGRVLGQVVLLCSGVLCGFVLLMPLELNLCGIGYHSRKYMFV